MRHKVGLMWGAWQKASSQERGAKIAHFCWHSLQRHLRCKAINPVLTPFRWVGICCLGGRSSGIWACKNKIIFSLRELACPLECHIMFPETHSQPLFTSVLWPVDSVSDSSWEMSTKWPSYQHFTSKPSAILYPFYILLHGKICV